MSSPPLPPPPHQRWRGEEPAATPRRARLYRIIFEADTHEGRLFDLVLIAAIVVAVGIVLLETLPSLAPPVRARLRQAEWVVTVLFTVEYVLRLLSVRRPLKYATSFFGVVDLLSFLPSYASLFLPGGHYFAVIRILRLLRIFRILKLSRFLTEASVLTRALRASLYKIVVFLLTVVTLVVVIGALMYMVEGPAHGFDSIPRGMYWAVVTLTTVGFGDIYPSTPMGQFLASLVMILGYGIIAVPTGIVSVELAQATGAASAAASATPTSALATTSTVHCAACGEGRHDADAAYCKRCGQSLAVGVPS
ncbi:MAG TPA: ion transporter [Gemmatimonadaceae bacterium]|nr:ion transporter [Gemmatimonadaceae bacterium]